MRASKRKQTYQSNVNFPFFESQKKPLEPSALNLIELQRDKLILNEEAIQALAQIKEDIIIVFIFGKEGTSKNILMNLLINSEEKTKNKILISNSMINNRNKKGFKIDSFFNSIQGNKKGIYFWSSPLEKKNSNEKIIFVDSFGINSEKIYQQNLESKLFALMIVISSIFIYNTVGDINSHSLNDLQLIVQLTDSINVEGKIDKDEIISELCPKFIWTLRDLDYEKYKQIKKNEVYLEECLNDDRFKGKNKDEINMINESLIKLFKKRECIAMPSPAQDIEELINIKKIDIKQLNENFQDEFNVLKKKIFETSEAKMINSKKITGPILVNLLKLFIKEINNDNIPNIDTIFSDLIKVELNSYYTTAINEFKIKLEKLIKEIDIDIKEIYFIKYESMNEFMKILEKMPEIYNRENYMKEYQTTKEKLENEIEKIIKTELDILISDNSYEKILEEKDRELNIKELIEDYLNTLIEFKMDMTDAILTQKDFDIFIQNDLKKTKEIMEQIKKEKNNNKNNDQIEENNNNNDENDINKIKSKLENAEKEELKLIGTFTQLLEKRDKCLKNSIKYSNNLKRSIRSYSSKLLINMDIEEEEKEDNFFEADKKTERCNCNLTSFKNCNIF